MSYMDQYASLEVPAVPVPEHAEPSSAVVASSVAVAKTGTLTQQDGQASQLLVSSSLCFPFRLSSVLKCRRSAKSVSVSSKVEVDKLESICFC